MKNNATSTSAAGTWAISGDELTLAADQADAPTKTRETKAQVSFSENQMIITHDTPGNKLLSKMSIKAEKI